MKTQESDLLETLSKEDPLDGLDEDELEVPASQPSLQECFEQLVLDKQDGLLWKCLLNSPEIRRRQILLLLSIIPSKFLLEKIPEMKEVEYIQLKDFIKKTEAEGGFQRLIDIQEQIYKQSASISVDRAIRLEDDTHLRKLSFNQRRQLVDGLLAERSILGFKVLQQTHTISRNDCISYWKALSENVDLRRYMQPPSLKQQATQSVGLILKYFVKGEDPDRQEELQKQLLEDVINSKCLKCLDNNPQIELSRQNKERLRFWILQIEVFKQYCNADTDALQQAKMEFGWSLLNTFAPDKIVIDPKDKYELIEKQMENPSIQLSHFNITPSQKQILSISLVQSPQLSAYLRQLNSKPLKERKFNDIRRIVEDLCIEAESQKEVEELLNTFDFTGLYSHRSIRNKYAEAYQLINGVSGLNNYASYHQARADQNNDIIQCQHNLRRIMSNTLQKYNVGNMTKQSNNFIEAIITVGDWSILKNNPYVSIVAREQLTRIVIESNDYKLVRRYRHIPVSLKQSAKAEIQAILVGCNIPSFDMVIKLTNDIVEGLSMFYVNVCEAISDQNKRIIQELLLDAVKCPKLAEYTNHFRRQWKLDEFHFREAILSKYQNSSIPFELLQKLLATICKELSYECVQSEKHLTECDRVSLLDFFQKEQVCREFTQTCFVVVAVNRRIALLDKVELMFKASNPQPKPIDMRDLMILKRAITDFLLIDQHVIDEVSYNSVGIKELKKNPYIWQLLNNLYQTNEFVEFRKVYPFLISLRSQEKVYETIFKRFVEEKGVSSIDTDDLLKLVNSPDDFMKKLEKLSFDNNELMKNVVYIEQQCFGWQIYRERKVLQKVIQHCDNEMKLIEYQNFIDKLQYSKEFQRLSADKAAIIMQGFKQSNLKTFQQEEEMLSRKDKHNICLQVFKSAAYQAYFSHNNNDVGRKFNDSIEIFLPRQYNPLGASSELYDMDFITHKAGDRTTQLYEKFRLFSGLRITKEQIRLNFREEFVKGYLIQTERARRLIVKSLIEEESTILATVINGSNRSLPDILHLLFTEGKCQVPELPGLTHMTSKKFEQEYHGRPRFIDMKLILEQLAYIDALDAFKPSLNLVDAVRDHTSELINELLGRNMKQFNTIQPLLQNNENKKFVSTKLSRPEPYISSVLSDLGNSDLSRPIKRLTKFVPLSN